MRRREHLQGVQGPPQPDDLRVRCWGRRAGPAGHRRGPASSRRHPYVDGSLQARPLPQVAPSPVKGRGRSPFSRGPTSSPGVAFLPGVITGHTIFWKRAADQRCPEEGGERARDRVHECVYASVCAGGLGSAGSHGPRLARDFPGQSREMPNPNLLRQVLLSKSSLRTKNGNRRETDATHMRTCTGHLPGLVLGGGGGPLGSAWP